MTVHDQETLAAQIEALSYYDSDLTGRAFDQVAAKLPEMDKKMIDAGALGTVDSVILLIDHEFPGWSLRMDGIANEKNGHWHCTLRKSSSRDNDAFIGMGKGPKLSNALTAALLRSLARKARTGQAD